VNLFPRVAGFFRSAVVGFLDRSVEEVPTNQLTPPYPRRAPCVSLALCGWAGFSYGVGSVPMVICLPEPGEVRLSAESVVLAGPLRFCLIAGAFPLHFLRPPAAALDSTGLCARVGPPSWASKSGFGSIRHCCRRRRCPHQAPDAEAFRASIRRQCSTPSRRPSPRSHSSFTHVEHQRPRFFVRVGRNRSP